MECKVKRELQIANCENNSNKKTGFELSEIIISDMLRVARCALRVSEGF
jgi:hypothetical protein